MSICKVEFPYFLACYDKKHLVIEHNAFVIKLASDPKIYELYSQIVAQLSAENYARYQVDIDFKVTNGTECRTLEFSYFREAIEPCSFPSGPVNDKIQTFISSIPELIPSKKPFEKSNDLGNLEIYLNELKTYLFSTPEEIKYWLNKEFPKADKANNKIKHLLQFLQNSDINCETSYGIHKKTIELLREITDEALNENKTIPSILLKRILCWLFTTRKTLRWLTRIPQTSQQGEKDFDDFYYGLRFNSAFNGVIKIEEDSFLSGGIPNIKGKPVSIQLGNVICNNQNKLCIAPEFKFFVKMESSLLYIHLIDPSNPIHNLFKNLETKRTKFRTIALDRNSDFYFQKGEFQTKSLRAFKDCLFSHCRAKSISWPMNIQFERMVHIIENHIENTQITYFRNSQNLTPKERTVFIEIFYITLIRKIFFKRKEYAYFTVAGSPLEAPLFEILLQIHIHGEQVRFFDLISILERGIFEANSVPTQERYEIFKEARLRLIKYHNRA